MAQSSEVIHRSPPHSAEMEMGAIGSMLLAPREVIGQCVEQGTTEEYFYTPAHQIIFALLVELWRSGTVIDLLTFTQTLRDRKLMESIGGEGTIERMYNFVPTSANASYYFEAIKEKFILRKIISVGTESVRLAYEEHEDVTALLSDFERNALAVRPTNCASKEPPIKDDVMGAIESIEAQMERKGAISGLETGFVELDRMTNGLQPAEMIVIAGRPSMGKTALAMNIAEHVVLKLKLKVGIFSVEMSRQQLVQRLICSRARVNLQKVRDGFLSERDYPALKSAAAKIGESGLIINDSISDLDGIVAKGRRWQAEHDIKLLILDYLQMLQVHGFKGSELTAAISHASTTLKRLAKELHIPFIVVAQLNRQPETRGGGKPRMSDLKQSGNIEQDADLIALLYREEVYEEDEERGMELHGQADLIIAKQRNGPIGEIPLTFLKEFTRFETRAQNIHEPESW